MRTLSSTLLSAQKADSRVPYFKVVARNNISGHVHLKWDKLYTGNEPDYYHAVTMPGDGSLVRVRAGHNEDNNKLYRQKIVSPGSLSDFSAWTYAGQYGCQAVAVASLGSEVGIFWVNLNQELKCLISNDYGASWGSAATLDYSPYAIVEGIAAVYKSNGDIIVFFAAENNLYVKKRINGAWEEKSTWDKATGYLTSVAAVHTGDWDLVVAGQDANSNYKLWSVVYGDGGAVPVGAWSELKEIASAPAGGAYEFSGVYLDKTDVFELFYIETFKGVEPYNRPYRSSTVPETEFLSSLWREPMPFNASGEYGLAVTHFEDYCWLSCPNSVWRASMEERTVELTEHVINARVDMAQNAGKLTLELQNSNGKFNLPGAGDLLTLETGCQLDVSSGYVTAQGFEVSDKLSFCLEAYEHISSGGKSSLVLHSIDGWRLLEGWRARHQFRWNQDTAETSVKQILEFILARVGIKLDIKSQSAVIVDFCPDFTIHPGDVGAAIAHRLLSYVPDFLFMEGERAVLVNPQESDSSTYSYGPLHVIFRGRYLSSSLETNQVRIDGFDEAAQANLAVDVIDWQELEKFPERFQLITDRNIGSMLQAQALGETLLRKYCVGSIKGTILIPVNCGQQLYDVIDITDSRAGLLSAKRRVMGIILEYQPAKGVYTQQLNLGGV